MSYYHTDTVPTWHSFMFGIIGGTVSLSTLSMLYTQPLRLVVTALAGLNLVCVQSINKSIMVSALYIHLPYFIM